MSASEVDMSLKDLEAFDPTAGGVYKRERRFCCPMPACSGKAASREHRSLTVNMETGAWHCWRCQAAGKLKEFWTERPTMSAANARRSALDKAFDVRPINRDPVEPRQAVPADQQADTQTIPSEAAYLAAVEAFSGSPAARYLEARGIGKELATAHGCGYSADWHGFPRVVFPVRDRGGRLVALNGRACAPCGRADHHRTDGPKGLGVFNPGALSMGLVAIAESPIKALALLACGIPAIGLMGTTAPDWLRRALAFKDVWIATDGDAAGDTAAEVLTGKLDLTSGGRKHRLRPPDGFKDWDDALLAMGLDALSAWLAERVPAVAETLKRTDAPAGVPLAHVREDLAKPRIALPGAAVSAWMDGAWRLAVVRAVWGGPGDPDCPPDLAGMVAVLVEGHQVETLLPLECVAERES